MAYNDLSPQSDPATELRCPHCSGPIRVLTQRVEERRETILCVTHPSRTVQRLAERPRPLTVSEWADQSMEDHVRTERITTPSLSADFRIDDLTQSRSTPRQLGEFVNVRVGEMVERIGRSCAAHLAAANPVAQEPRLSVFQNETFSRPWNEDHFERETARRAAAALRAEHLARIAAQSPAPVERPAPNISPAKPAARPRHAARKLLR